MHIRFAFFCLTLAACLALPACRRAEKPDTREQKPIDQALEKFDQKNYDAALAILLEVQKQEPESPFVLNLIGAALTKKKDFDGARKVFDQAIEKNPNFFPARFNLGELLFLQKNYPQALDYFTRLLAAAPGNELVQFKVVLSLIQTDQAEDARKLASRMRFPGEGPAWYYAHAAVALKEGNKAKASEYLSGARTFFPDATSLYNETFEDLGWPIK